MTTLYRFYGGRRLLYVGITDNVSTRFTDHAKKAWWSEVTNIAFTTYADRAAALEAEVEAIRQERPAYNVAGTGRSRALPVAGRVQEFETLAQAAARLGICVKTLRRRIADGSLTGYRLGSLIRVDRAEVDALLRPIPATP